MGDWLYEGRASVYLLLGAVGFAFLLTWYRNQKKKWLWFGVLVAVAFAGGYAMLDRAVETDGEQIKRKVQEMTAAVGRNDLDAAFQHFSEQFRTPAGTTKQAFKDLAKRYRSSSVVTEVVVWDFQFPEPPDPVGGKAKASFMVKTHGGTDAMQNLFARCEAVFERHAAAGWQMRGFELFDPARNNERIPFPY